MSYRWAALTFTLLVVGCSSSAETPSEEPAVETTTTTTISTTSTTSAPPEVSAEESAIAAAKQAVLDAGVMGADFVDSSIAEVIAMGDTLEVTLFRADPDIIGATAVVDLRKLDLSVIEVRHYR